MISRSFRSFSTVKPVMPHSSHRPEPYTGPSFEEVVKLRKAHMPDFCFTYYKKPLLITEGYKQYLFDHTGRQYIDLTSGISTVNCGHSHPRITRVIQDQASKLMHISPVYYQQYQGQYSKMLAESLGEGFDTVFLANSGAEANDMALLISRLYTGASKIVSLRYGYHGLVGTSQSITNTSSWNQPIVRGYDVEKLAYPSSYRGLFTDVDSYIREAEQALNCNTSGKVAAFIAEPIMGVGSLQPLPPTYLEKMYKLIRSYGGLCIADEVQTGFGRIGKQFWGFNWHGVKPDIVTMAKGIGNGFPMAAVATRKEIMNTIKKIYFNTFGGGLLQCRIGMEVLKIIKDQKLHENAEEVGAYLKRRLLEIQKKSRVLGDVRGKGLMIGIEIVKDKETKEAAADLAVEIFEEAKDHGILISKGGIMGNVFRIIPPLCLTKADAAYTADVLEMILTKY